MSQMQGPPPISAAQKAEMEKSMAKMSPEMRARIEAAQKASQANMAKPHVHKSCVTQEDLNKPLPFDNGKDDGKCTRTVLKATSSTQEFRVDCASDKYKSTATVHITASSSESWAGTMDSTIMPADGKTNTVFKMNVSGKWLGAACGDVKPQSQK
ncbi:MAG: DUF3617 domain-containing protein [Acidobacteriia bacterium]|nr:DUF3617 domain-containing protein [Terriglobia bacterium]